MTGSARLGQLEASPPFAVVMRRSFWLREPHPQGSSSGDAEPLQTRQPEPLGPYCLLTASGALLPLRPGSATAVAAGGAQPWPLSLSASQPPTLAWSRSHGDA